MSAQDDIKFSAFVTPPLEDKWQVAIATPHENYIDYPYKGRLFGVISLTNPQNRVDCISVGEMLQDYILDAFYESDEPSIIDLLEETIRKTKEKLSEILTQSKVIGNEVVDMEITLMSIRDNVFYIASFGESEIFLYNKSRKISLSQYLKDTSGRNQVMVMSGILKENDKILVAISGSLNRVIDTKLLSHIHEFDLGDLIPNVRAGIHSCTLLIGYKLYGSITKKSVDDSNINQNNLQVNYEEEQHKDIRTHTKEKKPIPDEIYEEQNEKTSLNKSEVVEEYIPDIDKELENKEMNQETPALTPKTGKGRKEMFNSKAMLILVGIKTQLSKVFSKDNQTTVVILFKKTFNKLKIFIISLVNKIKDLLTGRRRPKQLFVKQGDSKKRFIPIIVGIIVIFLILVFVIRQISINNEEQKKLTEANNIFSQAQQLSDQAKSVLSLNRERAATLLNESNTKLNEAETYNKINDQINTLRETNNTILLDIEKVIVIGDKEIISDVALKYPSFKPKGVVVTKDDLVVNQEDKIIYKDLAKGGNLQRVEISDTKISQTNIIAVENGGGVVIYNPKSGLFSYNLNENKVEKLVGLSDTVIGEISAMTKYSVNKTDYMYITKTDTGAVSRMTKLSGGYSLPETRLSNEAFKSSTDLDIDGKIWVTTSSEILRYNGTKEEKVNLNNTTSSKKITTINKIALSSKYLFVVDNPNKRVQVFTKGATNDALKLDYIASIAYKGTYGEFGDIIDIYIENETLYILDGKRIYSFAINIPESYLSN